MNTQTTAERKTQVISRIKDWILEKHPGVENIADDEDLLESELINSLQFISLLMYIEELRGLEIDEDKVELESFQTLDRIYENFLTDPANA